MSLDFGIGGYHFHVGVKISRTRTGGLHLAENACPSEVVPSSDS